MRTVAINEFPVLDLVDGKKRKVKVQNLYGVTLSYAWHMLITSKLSDILHEFDSCFQYSLKGSEWEGDRAGWANRFDGLWSGSIGSLFYSESPYSQPEIMFNWISGHKMEVQPPLKGRKNWRVSCLATGKCGEMVPAEGVGKELTEAVCRAILSGVAESVEVPVFLCDRAKDDRDEDLGPMLEELREMGVFDGVEFQ